MKVFILILSLLICPKTFAKVSGPECSPVDLRSSLGQPRDQGDTGWCYAHTAADLISFRLGHRISAFDVATTFTFTDIDIFGKQDPRTTGFMTKNRGAEARWRYYTNSQKNQLVDGVVECFQEGYYQYGGLDEVAVFVANHRGFCSDGKLPRTPTEIEAAAADVLKVVEGLRPPTQSEPASLGVGSPFFKAVISNWIDQRCGTRVVPNHFVMPSSIYVTDSVYDFFQKYPSVAERAQAQEPMFQVIDARLSRGYPVSIGYSAFDLLDASARPLKFRSRWRHRGPFMRTSSTQNRCQGASAPGEPDPTDEMGDHASLIVARKKINGQCHYFVRNSFGASCEDYRSELLSRCEPASGGAWVTREELGTVYSIVWL